MTTPIRLTQLAHGGGCGCKIAPALLQEIIGDSIVKQVVPNLLVGVENSDDAAVYQINDEQAIVAGVAVIASDIPAHRALLGDDYGAFFRSGDDAQLAALIARANDDRDWLSARQAQLSHRAPLFSPQHEAQQLCRLLTGLMTPP